MHSDAPASGAYYPAGQASQSIAPDFENVPAGHVIGAVEVLLQNSPALQEVQLLAPSKE